jgi:hypothetical protein
MVIAIGWIDRISQVVGWAHRSIRRKSLGLFTILKRNCDENVHQEVR